MARTDTLRNEIARLQKSEADVRKDIGKQEAVAAGARAAAAKKRGDAAKTKSGSLFRSHLRSAETEEKKVAAAEKKIGDLRAKLAKISKDQSSKTKSLGEAERSERQSLDRADGKRRKLEKQHATEVAQLSRPTVHYLMVPEPKPEKLRVLYLTSNPEATERTYENLDGSIVRESSWLRTEAEVRDVKNALRGSKYSNLVEVDHKSAATLQDLLNGINDMRPHIVHFSGHGGGQALLLDNGSNTAPAGTLLPFDMLMETLAATDTPPTLLVMNACDTLDGAEAILPAVPVIIAMSDSIGDAAATAFATQFYAGIASAQSVGASLRQGKVAIRAVSLDDARLPEYLARDEIDIDTLMLVHTSERFSG